MLLSDAFGQVLRQIRHERGFSQEQLGFESGYHRTYISLLERGKKTPTLQTVFRLAWSLDFRPSDVVRRVEALVGDSRSTMVGSSNFALSGRNSFPASPVRRSIISRHSRRCDIGR